MVLAALSTNGRAIAYMFGLSSTLAVTHNLVNYKLVQHTSAVSATVIGEVKTIALIILSAFLLGACPPYPVAARPCMRRAAARLRNRRRRPVWKTARRPLLRVAACGAARVRGDRCAEPHAV
jgi:hypothetical protein